MTPVMRSCIGLFACLALTLTVADAVRAADSSAGAPPPVTASQSAAAQDQPPAVHPSHEQLAQEMEEEPDPRAWLAPRWECREWDRGLECPG